MKAEKPLTDHEIKEKIRTYLEEKQQLSLTAEYFLLKITLEEVWDDIQDETNTESDDDLEEDDFDDTRSEPKDEEETTKKPTGDHKKGIKEALTPGGP